jgi:hypothetical protein
MKVFAVTFVKREREIPGWQLGKNLERFGDAARASLPFLLFFLLQRTAAQPPGSWLPMETVSDLLLSTSRPHANER